MDYYRDCERCGMGYDIRKHGTLGHYCEEKFCCAECGYICKFKEAVERDDGKLICQECADQLTEQFYHDKGVRV